MLASHGIESRGSRFRSRSSAGIVRRGRAWPSVRRRPFEPQDVSPAHTICSRRQARAPELLHLHSVDGITYYPHPAERPSWLRPASEPAVTMQDTFGSMSTPCRDLPAAADSAGANRCGYRSAHMLVSVSTLRRQNARDPESNSSGTRPFRDVPPLHHSRPRHDRVPARAGRTCDRRE